MLPPDFFTDPANRTQFGESGKVRRVFISHMDWIFLDLVLAAHPHWINLVETGTCYGLTSLYLGTIAKLRGGELHTFDLRDQCPQRILEAWPGCVHFHRADLLSKPSDELIEHIREPHTFVFFDNGDKEAEIRTYAPFLAPGSGFVAHDYGTEWRGPVVTQVLAELGFECVMLGVAVGLETLCRAFKRRL